jgi:hypothetical protein
MEEQNADVHSLRVGSLHSKIPDSIMKELPTTARRK